MTINAFVRATANMMKVFAFTRTQTRFTTIRMVRRRMLTRARRRFVRNSISAFTFANFARFVRYYRHHHNNNRTEGMVNNVQRNER